MRVNLTKKDLVNLIYMQLGFSKQIAENLIDDFLLTISLNIKNEKKLKLSKFGTFSIREKKSRIGRNPKTKERKIISERKVVLFKPSKEFKDFINSVKRKMIDSHCHLDHEPLINNLNDVIKRSKEIGIKKFLQYAQLQKVLII